MARFRPRLSFSLRTMFVLATLLTVGVGYVGRQWQFVRERTEIRNWRFAGEYSRRDARLYKLISITKHGEAQLPVLRRMLGDDHPEVNTVLEVAKEDRVRILAAFPDAEVVELSDESWQWVPIDRNSLR